MPAANSNLLGVSYIEWSTIIAGSVLACAVSLILMQFGSGLGFSVLEASRYEGDNPVWRIIVVGLWLFWVQLMASMSGAYLAGRMRSPMENAATYESEIRDGAHGLLVWATSTLAAAAAVAIAGFLTAAAQQGMDMPKPRATENTIENAGIIFGFLLAASSIVSAVAAWWIATVGGDHRDNRADASRYISFRKRGRK